MHAVFEVREHVTMEGKWSFGYGSNMNINALRVKGVIPLESMAARLDNHDLVFGEQGGMAGAVEAPGKAMYGVAHRLTAEDYETLVAKEGGDQYYHLKDVDVVSLVDATRVVRVQIFALHADNWNVQKAGRPTERYLLVLIEGAEHFNLPSDWIARLRSQPFQPQHRPFVPLPSAPSDTIFTSKELDALFKDTSRVCFEMCGRVCTVDLPPDTPKERFILARLWHGKKHLEKFMGAIYYYPGLPEHEYENFLMDYVRERGGGKVQVIGAYKEDGASL
jgi:hypothetical protein